VNKGEQLLMFLPVGYHSQIKILDFFLLFYSLLEVLGLTHQKIVVFFLENDITVC